MRDDTTRTSVRHGADNLIPARRPSLDQVDRLRESLTKLPRREFRRPRRFRRPIRQWLRTPVAHWVAVAALAFGVAGWLDRRTEELERREDALGPDVEVAVAARDLDAGATVTPEDVVLRAVPRGLVPDSALEKRPSGRRVAVSVSRDEVLLADRLTTAPSSLAARTPSGRRAMAIAHPPEGLALSVGDRVDVIALSGSGSTTVVSGAEVLEMSDDAATVVVPSSKVEEIADAVFAGTLTLALVGAE